MPCLRWSVSLAQGRHALGEDHCLFLSCAPTGQLLAELCKPVWAEAQAHTAPQRPPTAAARAALDAAAVKPQILHMHRQPSPRPPASVAYLFTGLALAPLGALAAMLNSVGINFKVGQPHPAALPTPGRTLVPCGGRELQGSGSVVAVRASLRQARKPGAGQAGRCPEHLMQGTSVDHRTCLLASCAVVQEAEPRCAAVVRCAALCRRRLRHAKGC